MFQNREPNMTQLAPISAEKRSNPKCRACGVTMSLYGIEPHPTIERADLLTYLCSHCDRVQTEIVAPAESEPMDSLLANRAFDAETTRFLGSAFDAAWERIEETNIQPAEGQVAMRELLAKFIIAKAEQGEKDPRRLIETALRRLRNDLRRGHALEQDNGLC
jgi:hypothetical protein